MLPPSVVHQLLGIGEKNTHTVEWLPQGLPDRRRGSAHRAGRPDCRYFRRRPWLESAARRSTMTAGATFSDARAREKLRSTVLRTQHREASPLVSNRPIVSDVGRGPRVVCRRHPGP